MTRASLCAPEPQFLTCGLRMSKLEDYEEEDLEDYEEEDREVGSEMGNTRWPVTVHAIRTTHDAHAL